MAHLEAEGVQFLHIAFQWMNCYLARELPLPLVIRLWDTYLAEPDGFERFHVYVCAALILQFADEFKSRDSMVRVEPAARRLAHHTPVPPLDVSLHHWADI